LSGLRQSFVKKPSRRDPLLRRVDFEPAAESPLLERAVELAFRYRTTVCDSCFVALADIPGVALVTADEKLIATAGKRAGIVRLSEAAAL